MGYYTIRNRIKQKPNWEEADQLAMYKSSREVEPGLPETNPAGGQSGT